MFDVIEFTVNLKSSGGKLKVKNRIELYERVAAVIQEFHALDLANLEPGHKCFTCPLWLTSTATVDCID